MTLEFRCADVGLACDARVTAETEDELVSEVAEHARSAHDVELNQTLIDYAKTTVRTT